MGSSSYISDVDGEVAQHVEYFPFGETFLEEHSNTDRTPYLFNGKELDEETRLYYYGARYYDARTSVWQSVDPLAEKYANRSPYEYTQSNPVNLVDPNGREPIKPYAGTIGGFSTFFNNLSSGIGTSKGNTAHTAMLRMGAVNWSMKGPRPANTAPFNTSNGNRYIYTKKGGWIDMSHFMFYAGRAYQAKLDKQRAQSLVAGMKKAGIPYSEIPKRLITASMSDPLGEAVQEGYMQEKMDEYGPTYSAYSYEDLPSDKFGADFAINHFDPDSDLTFGEQLQNYFKDVLKATNPESAPNYEKLPTKYPKKGELPSVQNRTTKPMFIKE